MQFPTWEDLQNYHCCHQYIKQDMFKNERNPFYEEFAQRRFNYAASGDVDSCRMVFLKGVLGDDRNKTLVRGGRFLWCKNFKYEGRSPLGVRQLSFTVDKGQKRFVVSEHNALCLPSKVYVNGSRFVRPPHKTFIPFSSALHYPNTVRDMSHNMGIPLADLREVIRCDAPYKPGSLVFPRLGYFYPDPDKLSKMKKLSRLTDEHPCGIILGPSYIQGDSYGREFYRVRFGNTTYERVHPTQMEIINEV